MTLLTALLALPVAVLTAPAAHACSCPPPESESTLSQSDLIAEVTVTGADVVAGDRVYDLRVEREWKGPGRATARLTTARDVTACGLLLDVGQSYILFANERASGGWQSSWCTATFKVGAQTTIVSRADIEEHHGSGTVPVRSSDEVTTSDLIRDADPVPWLILSAAVLLVIMVGLGLALVRRGSPGPGR